MNDSIQVLRERIEFLEHVLQDETALEAEQRLLSMVDQVEASLNSIFAKSHPLKAVLTSINALGLWKEIEVLETEFGLSNSETNSTQPNKGLSEEPSREPSLEIKTKMVTSAGPQIVAVAESLEKLSSIQFPDPCRSADLAKLKSELPGLVDRVKELVSISEELSIRTAQALRVWIEGIVLPDSQMWADAHEVLLEAERNLRALDAKAREESKP